MEKFISKRDSKKYGFKKGDEFTVYRTYDRECVLMVKDELKPNIIMDEKEVLHYGELTGTPLVLHFARWNWLWLRK